MTRRPNLSPEQRNRIIARAQKLLFHRPASLRFSRVALRLQYWLAGVDNGAQWAALYDHIEHQYRWGKISHEEAVAKLRDIGLGAVTGLWKFTAVVEQHHRMSQAWSKQKQTHGFNAVKWEMDFNKLRASGE